MRKYTIGHIFLVLLLVLPGCDERGQTSAPKQSQFAAVDEQSETAYTVLAGYLKRRQQAPSRDEFAVKSDDAGLIFVWNKPGEKKYFHLQKKSKAWVIQELNTESLKPSPPY